MVDSGACEKCSICHDGGLFVSKICRKALTRNLLTIHINCKITLFVMFEVIGICRYSAGKIFIADHGDQNTLWKRSDYGVINRCIPLANAKVFSSNLVIL
jgi:hypothetical protein